MTELTRHPYRITHLGVIRSRNCDAGWLSSEFDTNAVLVLGFCIAVVASALAGIGEVNIRVDIGRRPEVLVIAIPISVSNEILKRGQN
jgi:hypothetical protein